jgi:hypothetical protein
MTGTMAFEITLDGTLMASNPDFIGGAVSYQFAVTPGLPRNAAQGESAELRPDTPGAPEAARAWRVI